ncbi:unnamed protein product [Pelagomonas calceolata]|uniref:Myosin motor domain-containing protein n=1 Tax=Pelagomonas calceolata TaxID=35677 RepID=A0A8J2T190_9STRA|nr:unnamed protein product [Pelagomonas calceolata]
MDDGGVLLEKLGSDVERLTNDKTLEETEDMAALENLSEATMLECLRRRYRRDRIYSSLGGVVVAINPFRKIERLYDDGYARFGAGDDANLLKPHPYALAESAVRGVVRDRTSQSLLVIVEGRRGFATNRFAPTIGPLGLLHKDYERDASRSGAAYELTTTVWKSSSEFGLRRTFP